MSFQSTIVLQTPPTDHMQATREPSVTHQQDLLPSTYQTQQAAVYGSCGHVARSEQHTCGAPNCIQIYGW